jgi:hypothetical protein
MRQLWEVDRSPFCGQGAETAVILEGRPSNTLLLLVVFPSQPLDPYIVIRYCVFEIFSLDFGTHSRLE